MGYFSNEDIVLIQNYMNNNINARNPKPGRLIYSALLNKLSIDVDQAKFCSLLSLAVKEGLITGFVGKRRVGYVVANSGSAQVVTSQIKSSVRAVLDIDGNDEEEDAPDTDPHPESDTDPAPPPNFLPNTSDIPVKKPVKLNWNSSSVSNVKIPEQSWKQVEKLSVIVGKHTYKVPMARCDIKALLFTVLQAEKTDSGPVQFDNEYYNVNDLDLLERFLLCFFESTLVIGQSAA